MTGPGLAVWAGVAHFGGILAAESCCFALNKAPVWG